MVVRALAVVMLAPLFVAVIAGPAAAHGRASDATNMVSRIAAAPDTPGVTWQIYGNDEYLAVNNTTDTDLLVDGYQEEPYLRIGSEGVFVNERSPAHYQNQDRYAEVETPPDANPSAEPLWVKVSDGTSYAWHDHRVHWMSTNTPGSVTDPNVRTRVLDWTVPYTLGDESHEVSGTLDWVPGGSPFPWLAAAAVLVLPGLLGLRARSRDGREWVTAMARPAAVVVGVVALLNVPHLVDDLFAVPVVPLASKALAAGQTMLFIGIGLFGALRAWQGRDGAFTALGVASGALLVGQGILYFSVLSASQTASLFPGAFTRGVIALSLAQAIPAAIIAVLGNSRLAAEAPPSEVSAPATPQEVS